MQTLRFLSVSLLATSLAACSSGNVQTAASLPFANQSQRTAGRPGVAPHCPEAQHVAPGHGRALPNAKPRRLLYVSDLTQNVIDVFSLPNLAEVDQITAGIDNPNGIATDQQGRLYVANFGTSTVTIYKPGKICPSQTLFESNGANDVALTKNGHLLVADAFGGVNVYAPGATTSNKRLTNPAILGVRGVAADAHDNIYAVGLGPNDSPATVKYNKMSGPGKNLALTGLVFPAGVLVDDGGNLVVSDTELPGINIYPPGSATPSATIAQSESPIRSALDMSENKIYVPEGANGLILMYDYPSGTLVHELFIASGDNITGTALSPAPPP